MSEAVKWRTRTGLAVRIYSAVEGENIHGAIQEPDSTWKVHEWYRDGRSTSDNYFLGLVQIRRIAGCIVLSADAEGVVTCSFRQPVEGETYIKIVNFPLFPGMMAVLEGR